MFEAATRSKCRILYAATLPKFTVFLDNLAVLSHPRDSRSTLVAGTVVTQLAGEKERRAAEYRWYTALRVLARYEATKRLNEHLRTGRRSRVNRTWLILSRKICGGLVLAAAAAAAASSFLCASAAVSWLLFFHNTRANTYRSYGTEGARRRDPLVHSLFRFLFALRVHTSRKKRATLRGSR